MADVMTGGVRLRQLREAAKMTQRELEDALHGAVRAQQISRIEKGQVEKPPMVDLVVIGAHFGLDANAVAEAFGYRAPLAQEQEPSDARVVLLDTLARTASPDRRQKILHWVELILLDIQNDGLGSTQVSVERSDTSPAPDEPHAPDVATHMWVRSNREHAHVSN